MSARWEELDRIFAEARSRPAAEQAGYIAEACGTDAALRAEAESLLSASQLTGEFLERPALERLAKSFASESLQLRPEQRIGAYTLVRQLGFGGAGEVWRARDARLGRDVAIKFLLPHLTADAGKLRRFAEEAQAAGTLNHPNILTVHDVGEYEGMPYLVSECLEGRNLRERFKAGPVPVPVADATAIVLGIAQGLAAAHERGIVHRDLKPENTFLKPDGGVKLLDFGLAKLKLPAGDAREGREDGALSLVAGTAAYMAPEQARGEAPDPRSDLFALGVMAYEMLAGQHPFRGASVLETLHAILTREPTEVTTVNERIPPALARIVMRLLQKAPEARFQSARDLAWALSQAPEAPARASPLPRRSSRWLWFGLPAALVAALTAGWWLAGRQPDRAPAGELTRFTWALPAGTQLDSAPVVAPDGRRIAFAAQGKDGTRLYIRDLGSLESRAIAGTEGATLPFWSPDGSSLAFFTEGKLMKVGLPNGAPARIAAAPAGRGGTWNRDGTIVFSPDLILSGLSRVSADGGDVTPLTMLDASRGETSHWWPVALPDGEHFIYFVRSLEDDRRGIYVGRMDQPVGPAGERLFYAESGATLVPVAGSDDVDLIYLAGGRVEVRRLDVARLKAEAPARTLDFLPAKFTVDNPLMVTASKDVLAYADGVVPGGNRMMSLDLDGRNPREWEEASAHNWPRVSPDGKLIMRPRIDDTNSQPDILVEDLERGTVYPLVKTREPDMSPVWSPDGRQVAYSRGHLPGRVGPMTFEIAAADGTGVVHSMPCPGDYCEPTDWSTDGRTILLTVIKAGNHDVWTLPVNAEGAARPLLAGGYDEKDARYSPDGHWIAYVSGEAGQPEVKLQNAVGPPRRLVASGEGGTQPVWRRDGKALYFTDLDGRLCSVSVQWHPNGEPELGLPVQLEMPRIGFGHWGTQYDISPDGRRAYFMQPTTSSAPSEIQVAIHWQSLVAP